MQMKTWHVLQKKIQIKFEFEFELYYVKMKLSLTDCKWFLLFLNLFELIILKRKANDQRPSERIMSYINSWLKTEFSNLFEQKEV